MLKRAGAIFGWSRRVVNRPKSGVDAELDLIRMSGEELVRRSRNSTLHAGMLRSGGKLLRPRLLFLCVAHGAETGSTPDWEKARLAALAVELGHLGSLYHDDIADRSEARRGQASVHRRASVRQAALGGAELIALCNALLAELPASFAREWGRTAVRMADGQLRDTENAGNPYLPIEAFIETASRKTGAAFEMAASFGAVLGGVSARERNLLIRFGRYFGIAFQLANDLEDLCTDPRTHRIRGNDLRERIYSLPAIIGCAMEGANGARLRQLLEEDGRIMGEDQVAEATELLMSSGAIGRAAEITRERVQIARDSLVELSATAGRAALDDLAASIAIPGEGSRGERRMRPS